MQEFESLTSLSTSSLDVVDRLYEEHKHDICGEAIQRSFERPEAGSRTNLFGQWAATTHIAPSNAEGPLRGKTFGIKDNVAVAGVPCQNGSEMFRDLVPGADATVVRRILSAGGTIVGKTQCEKLCYSGGSHTSFPHPVRNPHDPQRHAGGSSSGSACAVAYGSCDVAIGGDQGGSIRLPSTWSGRVGFKPSWGLVPYTGAASMV